MTSALLGMLGSVAAITSGMGIGFDDVPDFRTMQTQSDVERNVGAAERKRARKAARRVDDDLSRDEGRFGAAMRAAQRCQERNDLHGHVIRRSAHDAAHKSTKPTETP